MKLIEVIKWEATNRAVVLVYAASSSNLAGEITRMNPLTISSGSLAYLANGKVYVYDGTNWNEIGGE